tara:strand:- start:9214 stop:9897 length:684 start_codon:yes stop_codon:yes gene_type:complete
MNKHLDHFKDAIKKDDLQQQYKRHVEDQQKRLVDITRKPTHLINYGDVCAEVGVWKGKYSWEILSRGPSKLHLIDPWVHQDYPVDDPKEARWYCCGQEKMDIIYNDVVQQFNDYSNVTKDANRHGSVKRLITEVKIHRLFSTQADFSEAYFDWVYIDANHSYENVLADLRHYSPLIKSGGILAGDDYGSQTHDPYANGGVKRGVSEFIEETGYEVSVENNQFMIRVE